MVRFQIPNCMQIVSTLRKLCSSKYRYMQSYKVKSPKLPLISLFGSLTRSIIMQLNWFRFIGYNLTFYFPTETVTYLVYLQYILFLTKLKKNRYLRQFLDKFIGTKMRFYNLFRLIRLDYITDLSFNTNYKNKNRKLRSNTTNKNTHNILYKYLNFKVYCNRIAYWFVNRFNRIQIRGIPLNDYLYSGIR